MGHSLQVLSDDGERILCRAWRRVESGGDTVLVARPAGEHPPPASDDRLAHEFGLKDELYSAWAVRPLELVRESGRTFLILEDPGGEPLDRLLGAPMDVGSGLRLAVRIAAALGKLHQRGVVHKNLKPSNILVNCADGQPRLTGFGIASRLPRERQALEPPETIAGTLAYMAPEQTGRMNRAIDSRSDLYAFGVTLYQMLTGALPFTAADAMEWIHCHIATMPVPPNERLGTIPSALSRVVTMLLAKNPEERYQTAAGVERDLERCLADWERQHRIDDFQPGEHDTPDRLLIPEKLYGRASEVDTLLAAFDRVLKNGAPELVLVSGYSGIGKSSVVNELQKVLVPPRGLFASGKFDQYKRDIPYATLVQAFQSLVRPLLGKCDSELASWRNTLLEALGQNSRLMTDLIPEVKLIIGEPPPVPELEPQQAQSRFQLVVRRFISVFARVEHPLALFLDDLQWLDAATLDLLEDLLTRSDLRHLMLIGAYRGNEVDATHPLFRWLRGIRGTGARIWEIALAPLDRGHIASLIADALHCEPQRAAPLAQLVHDKTAGNSFFVIQFLHALADEGLLTFDHEEACWSWDLDRIHAKGYTENVVDLMVGKLTCLPADTQQALQHLASLGNAAAVATLSIVLGISEPKIHEVLWEAVRQELVERLGDAYRFSHDRIQEAAYSLIPAALRAETHLRIGWLLAAQTPQARHAETIFDIVQQLNRGAFLITLREEREQLAEFNLLAGQRARSSTAYALALTYLNACAALLPENSWESRHELMFELEFKRAECEFLTGQFSDAEERLVALSNRAATTIERAVVACLRIDLYTARDQIENAINVGLAYLRTSGVNWVSHPRQAETRCEYDRIASLLGDRAVEALVDMPLASDPAILGTLDVLTKMVPAAMFDDANLGCLAICRAVNLSLEHGNSDASCFAYVYLGMVGGPHFGNYQAGLAFGKLGYDLVEMRGLKRFKVRTSMLFASHVMPWMQHVNACRELIRRTFHAANESGDLCFAAFSWNNLCTNLLTAGAPLREVLHEVEHGMAFAQTARFGLVCDILAGQSGLVRSLLGDTSVFGCFDNDEFDELQFERHLANSPALALPECF